MSSGMLTTHIGPRTLLGYERGTELIAVQPIALLEGLVFPESPRWHDSRLWFSDIHGHQVIAVDLDGKSEVIAILDKPSGLGFMPDGTPLVVSMDAQTISQIVDGEVRLHADLSEYPGEFLNDMVVDETGRAYVGKRSWRRSGLPPSHDIVILVHPDGSSEIAAEDLRGPNGTVITPGGYTLIVAETQALRLTAFDRDRDGRLSGRRNFASLGPEVFGDGRKAFPDGICLDDQGAVWVGTAISGEYLRVSEGGHIGERFVPNASWATACALGGPDRRTLFLATCNASLQGLRAMNDAQIPDHNSYHAWARTQSQGYIEVVKVDVPGAGIP